MFFKKSFKKVQEEINSYLNKGDYFYAGVLAENSGYKKLKKLSKEYYSLSVQRFKEKNLLKHLFPTEKSHKEILEHITNISEYSLNKPYIRN
jgi:hypothetical protein